MTLIVVLALLGGGFVAGFVNTVAGGGSVVTIPLLIELLGGNAIRANGTNRIAILLQNIVAVTLFRKGGMLPVRRVLPVVPAVILGAVGGAWLGTVIDSASMKRVFAFVILLVATSVVVKPKKWLGGKESKLKEPWRFLIFVGIGFYGGFIQAGVGFLLLGGLVLGSGFDLVRGNAAKLLLVLLYTPLCILLFAQAKQVEVAMGLVLGCGNMSGAFVASTLAVKKGGDWIRWVLLIAAVAAAARMLFF